MSEWAETLVATDGSLDLNVSGRPTDGKHMPIRLLAATVALLLAATCLTVSNQAPAADASSSKVLFGLTDHWKDDIIRDERQLRLRSGIVGLFSSWQASAQRRATVIRWMQWVRDRGGAPTVALQPPRTASL